MVVRSHPVRTRPCILVRHLTHVRAIPPQITVLPLDDVRLVSVGVHWPDLVAGLSLRDFRPERVITSHAPLATSTAALTLQPIFFVPELSLIHI